MEDLWSKTSAHFQRAVTTAERRAAKDSLKYVTTEHLLLGIVSWRNVAVSMLRSLGTDMAQVTEAVTALQIHETTDAPELIQDGDARELSSDAHRAVVYAREEGFRDGGKYVDEAHLLIGIIRCEATPATRALAGLGVTADGIRSSLDKLLAGTLNMKYFPEEATDATLGTVLGLLKDENPAVREEAVGQLHRWVNFRACDIKDHAISGRAALEAEFSMQLQVMQGPTIVDAMLAVMEDPDGNVRIKAPLLLGHVKAPAAQEAIIRHLRTETHPSIRLMCLLRLDWTADTPQKVAALIDCLRDTDDQIAYTTCINLGKLGDKLAIEPLRAVLIHDSWKVRFYACDALVRLGAVDSDVIRVLEELAQQPEAEEHDRSVEHANTASRKMAADNSGGISSPRTTEYVLELALQAGR